MTRLIAQDSHIPELAALAAPAQATATAESGWPAFRRFRDDADLAPRPLRLLAKPEPIEDVVSSVPDGPPARFRWRRALHEIVAAEGPERIEGVWWNEDGRPVRDYYRVEDAAGLRFWVFREKLYDLRPRNDPRDKAEAERRATANKGETESTDKTGSAQPTVKSTLSLPPMVHPRRLRVRRNQAGHGAMVRYIEFAVASNFSFLRGASHPEELMQQAAALGLDGIGLCDRNSVAGVVRPHIVKREHSLDARLSPRRAARVRRRHARHPRLSARPSRVGPSLRACSRAATCAPRRATAS